MVAQNKFADKYKQAKSVEECSTFASVTPGNGICRLVGAINMGPQYQSFQGSPVSVRRKVRLEFELAGPSWPEMNGRLPVIARTYTYGKKAGSKFDILWKALNWEGKLMNPLQAIGEVFGAEIRKEGETLVFEPNAPVTTAKATGKILEDVRGDMPPAISTLRGLDYDTPDMEDWMSVFDPGFDEESGKSFNFIQNDIRAADGFPTSPIAQMLRAEGRDIWTDYDAEGKELAGSRIRNINHVKEAHKANGFVTPENYFDAGNTTAKPAAPNFGAPAPEAPTPNFS